MSASAAQGSHKNHQVVNVVEEGTLKQPGLLCDDFNRDFDLTNSLTIGSIVERVAVTGVLMCVSGVYSVCLQCRHGGHLSHVTDWFACHSECPAGCGCHCLTIQRSPSTTSAEPHIQLTLS